MTLTHITALILVLNVSLLIGYDIWVKIKQPNGEATISWVVLQAVKHGPIIAVAVGIVIGHLFWQNCTQN